MARTPRSQRPPRFALAAPAPEPAAGATLPELPLDKGVRLVVEGSDPVAVEAAVAELKLRFGARFAVTDRRHARKGALLRVTGGLRVTLSDILDAGGA